MKTVIVSDVHLTHRFDEKKFLFLERLFSSYDRVILNGDFWDGYRTTFDDFVRSEWSALFPLLLKKKAVYIYGNHDQKRYSDDRVKLFSVSQKDSFLMPTKEGVFHIEHGHVYSPSIDMLYPLSRQALHYISVIFQFLESVFLKIRSPHNLILVKENNKIKQKLQSENFPFWYVCGHTHYPEKDIQFRFANSGFIQFGQASYLIVDSSGLYLQKTQY